MSDNAVKQITTDDLRYMEDKEGPRSGWTASTICSPRQAFC